MEEEVEISIHYIAQTTIITLHRQEVT